jgi:hypothetical protein
MLREAPSLFASFVSRAKPEHVFLITHYPIIREYDFLESEIHNWVLSISLCIIDLGLLIALLCLLLIILSNV